MAGAGTERVQCLCLAALMSGMAMSAAAEDTPARRQETFELYQEAAEVVSAAALHPQPTQEAPGNATVITAREIETYGYRTIAEALQSVPGIYFTDDRNYSYIWVRGFGRPGDFNSRILLLLNGHRLNENVYGGAYMAQIFPVPIQAVEKIEVIKGPGAALYGDNAFFGVVNVITKQPGEAPSVQTNLEAGSYGTTKAAAALSHITGGSNGLYATGEYRHMHGQDLEYPQFRSTNNGLAVNADGEENYNGFANWSTPGLSLQGAYENRTKHVPTASFNSQFNNPNEQTTDARGFMELKADRQLSPSLRAIGRLYLDQYSYHGYFPMTDVAPPDVTTNRDYARAWWYGEESTLRLAPAGAAHALLIGQDFEQTYDVRALNFNDDPYQLFIDQQHRLDRYAFFAQDEWTPATPLLLTLGLRYDHEQSYEDTVNPRLSAMIHPRESSTLKLMYGTAFRAPDPYELYGQGPGSDPNENLKPEKTSSYEADWVEQITARTSLTAGYFLNDIHDLINNVVVDAAGTTQFQNSEHVRSHGLELSSRWDLGSYSAHAGYLYQQTYEVGGTILSNSPMHTATAGVVRRWGAWATTAFDAILVGQRRTLQNTILPATLLPNFNISATPWANGLRLYLGIFNLFNTPYSVSGFTEHLQDAIPQNGRDFNGGVEYRFR